MNTYYITYVSGSYFFYSPEKFPSTSRIGSWPVEVLNPNIYQYTINAFKSCFILFWKIHCSHLTLEILKMLGLSPEFYVQESYFWRLHCGSSHFSFPLSLSQKEVLTQALSLHLFLPFSHVNQMPIKV